MNKKKILKSYTSGIDFVVKFFDNKRYLREEFSSLMLFFIGIICVLKHKKKKKEKNKLEIIIIDFLGRILELNNLELDHDDFMIVFYLYTNLNSKKHFNKYKLLYLKNIKSLKKDIEYKYQHLFRKKKFDDLCDFVIEHLFICIVKKNNKLPIDLRKKIPKHSFNSSWKLLKQSVNKQYLSSLNSDKLYQLTHIIYIHTHYNCYKPKHKPKEIKLIEEYFFQNSNKIIKLNDVDLLSEIFESMVFLGSKKWEKKYKKIYIKKILKRQRKRGNFYDPGNKTIYDTFHSTWTCLCAISLIL